MIVVAVNCIPTRQCLALHISAVLFLVQYACALYSAFVCLCVCMCVCVCACVCNVLVCIRQCEDPLITMIAIICPIMLLIWMLTSGEDAEYGWTLEFIWWKRDVGGSLWPKFPVSWQSVRRCSLYWKLCSTSLKILQLISTISTKKLCSSSHPHHPLPMSFLLNQQSKPFRNNCNIFVKIFWLLWQIRFFFH